MSEENNEITETMINPTSIDIETANIEARKKLNYVKELKAQKRKQDFKNFLKEAFVNKHGVFVWLFCSIFWFLLAFGIFTRLIITYTEQIVQKCYEKELKKELEEPLIQANLEADRIRKEAREQAEKIINAAKAETSE